MSEKNNKIKIGELLTQIEVPSLKEYFDTLNSEVWIKNLFERLSEKIMADAYRCYAMEDVFTLVSHIWKSYQNSKVNLGDYEIYCMFDTLCVALARDNREEKSNVPKALAMFQLIKDVWDARKTTEDGDVKLSQFTIVRILETLVYFIRKDNSTGLAAQEVFTFIKDVWDVREKEEDYDLKLSTFEIQLMFEALVFAIERGNSEGLKAKEVFDLVEDILNQQNLEIDSITVKFMLEALRLTYGIDEQLEKMESSLRALGLKIANGCICLTDNRESLPVDSKNVISILKIIKEQNTEEKKNQDNDNNKENNEQKNKNKKIEDKGKNGIKDEEDGSTTFNINQLSSFDAFYKEIKNQTNNKTEAMDNLLNDNKALSNVPINVWDIIKTFFWRLFCCMENPFHNLYNYTKLRVGFNQLKIQQQIGQDLSDSKLECELFTTLRSHLLSKQENSKVSEPKNGKNDLINK